MKTTIALLTFVVLTFQACGGVDKFHAGVDCFMIGENCPATVEYVERLDEEQQAELSGVQAQVAELMELLGRDRMEIEEIIDLCDNGREILIRIDGELIAYHNRRGGYLDVLGPGRYVSTDGKGCRFDVTQDLEVVYE